MTGSFNSSDEAKAYAIDVMAPYLSEEEIITRIEDFKRYKENAADSKETEFWHRRVLELEDWLGSEEFKKGGHPMAIDEMMLEMLELRAIIFAVKNTTLTNNLFEQHVFFMQWIMGATYAVFSIIGKLASKHPDDISLHSLWHKVAGHMLEDSKHSKEEIHYVSQIFDRNNGHFNSKNSKAMRIRNKIISHNEHSPDIHWEDIDEDMQILVRAWSMVISWSGIGLIQPFRDADAAFSGLEPLFANEELRALKSAREQYIQMARLWAVTQLQSGKIDQATSPFATIHVGISPAPDRTG